METIKNLSEPVDVEHYGGKAAALSKLIQCGFNVPPGFAVSTETVSKILRGETDNLPQLYLHIGTALENTLSPNDRVAVRSSGVFEDSKNSSFAGMFKTLLNVEVNLDTVLNSIKECSEAAVHPRLMSYLRMQGINQEENLLAIVVQKMITPEFSGVLFTSNRPDSSGTHLIIESIRGLGEQLVAGRTTPTRYYIERRPKSGVDPQADRKLPLLVKVGRGATLPKSLLRELYNQGIKIEECFSGPQDIEWCYQDRQLFILQSRPLTASLNVLTETVGNHRKNPKFIEGFGASPGKISGSSFVIRDEDDIPNFIPRSILVAENTDTEYLEAMQKSSGIVTEEGGLLSHAAIISRELGIPCVVGAKGVMRRFPTGSSITIDGVNGIVSTEKVEKEHSDKWKYDTSGLYCFDTIVEETINGQTILTEQTVNGLAVFLSPDLPRKDRQQIISALKDDKGGTIYTPSSDKYPIYFSWKRRMAHNPIFRQSFSRFSDALETLNADGLEASLSAIEESTTRLIEMFKSLDPNSSLDNLLTKYALLDTAGSNYMLSNTIIPEGYGIRAIYDASLPFLRENNVSFGQFIGDASMASRVNKDIPLFYKVLSKFRIQTYPRYLEIGATGDEYFENWQRVLKQLSGVIDVPTNSKDFDSAIATQLEAHRVWGRISTQ